MNKWKCCECHWLSDKMFPILPYVNFLYSCFIIFVPYDFHVYNSEKKHFAKDMNMKVLWRNVKVMRVLHQPHLFQLSLTFSQSNTLPSSKCVLFSTLLVMYQLPCLIYTPSQSLPFLGLRNYPLTSGLQVVLAMEAPTVVLSQGREMLGYLYPWLLSSRVLWYPLPNATAFSI